MLAHTIARRTILAVVCGISAHASCAFGDVLFESGTLGPTGVTFADLANGTVPGTNVHRFVFPGVRFELTQPVIVSEVGGHFVEEIAGTFFGAIVRLDDANDFPNSTDLSTSDVLGTTTLTFPNPSDEVFGDLNLSLDSGWYALVFGGGLFGTSGAGGAVRNGVDIGAPSYISFDPNFGWFNLDIFGTFFDNHRFVVMGAIVPEPSTFRILLTLLIVISWFRPKRCFHAV